MPLISITNDVFDIADRLRSVDESYRLFYNTERKRYEVYSANNFQFSLPYEQLDARAVNYARKTRVENAEEIFREVERHNAELREQAHAEAKEKALASLIGKESK